MSEHQVTTTELRLADAEDRIHELLELASRLRQVSGGELDDTAIAAVAEATGAPLEYVRLVVRRLPEQDKKSTLWDRGRAAFLAFNPDVRRMVTGGLLGLAGGLAVFLSAALRDKSSFLTMLSLITIGAGLWNAANARSVRSALLTGGIQASAHVLLYTLFAFAYQPLVPLLRVWHVAATPVSGLASWLLPFLTVLGAVCGVVGYEFLNRNRKNLGLHDPAEERQKLLQQFAEIQKQLQSDEQEVTFVSIDIVGSTRLKAEADALSVEYTFNEYHRYVEQVVAKNGGRVHSTAGDGVTCVFDTPGGGVLASKAVIAGLFEFNAMRNRIGKDIQLRAGVHTGRVLAPGKDAVSVNFSQVIDISAHIQKSAPIGAVAVSSETAKYLPGGLNAIGEERIEVQGLEAAVWKPSMRQVPVLPGASAN